MNDVLYGAFIGVVVILAGAVGIQRAWRPIAGGLVIGAVFVGAIAWLLGDALHIFGDFTLSAEMFIPLIGGGGFAGAAIGGLLSSGRRRWWHQVTAGFLIVTAVLTAGVGVNRAVGYFQSPGQIVAMLTHTTLPEIPELDVAGAQDINLAEPWTGPADMPEEGILVQATIPGETSGFQARPAIIYLPPAALVQHPPRLPVIVAFSGQPGSPSDIFDSGHLADIINRYASSHGGIAPIVVAPDQLGNYKANPMCLNSQLGENETYLVTDVMTWIRGNLPVLGDAAHTALIGFSQGGTCTVQLGFGHPELANTIVPISPQLEPTIGSHTVQVAFDGDEAEYKKNTPLALLDAHGTYSGMTAQFYVGEDDTKYSGWARTLVAAAQEHGIKAELTYSPGTGHSWHTARYGISHSFPFLLTQLGLPQ